MSTDELITEEWLREHGWKLTSPRNDANTQVPGFRLRPIAWECKDGPPPFVSRDDLCIAVAPSIDATPAGDGTPIPAYWFVWVYQLEPYRFIHVRHMRHAWELKRLWEGLTGQQWPAETKG